MWEMPYGGRRSAGTKCRFPPPRQACKFAIRYGISAPISQELARKCCWSLVTPLFTSTYHGGGGESNPRYFIKIGLNMANNAGNQLVYHVVYHRIALPE